MYRGKEYVHTSREEEKYIVMQRYDIVGCGIVVACVHSSTYIA
jgi:hypothetical protein